MPIQTSHPDLSEANRVDQAFRRENRNRLKSITISRTIAMLVVAVVVAIVAPWPSFLYYHFLILLFGLSGLIQFIVGRSRWTRDWFVYAFITLDMALLVFTLIYPNPFEQANFPPQFSLRFGNFLYLFIVLGALAITLRPLLPLWGGFTGALFWGIGIYWLTSLPGTMTEPGDMLVRGDSAAGAGAATTLPLNPYFIDLGVQFQNIVIFLVVAAMLSVATEAARRLLIRETGQARRVANLSRYLPAEAIAVLEARDDPFAQEREAEVAVLFTDVVGFSAMAETQSPQQVIALLREVHQLVEREVFEHGGILDKFIGDGAMATFGVATTRVAANGHQNNARNGIACLHAIITAARTWNESRAAKSLPPVRLSVGLHHGPVIVGDVGSARRTELAVIGDTVNVAARLEALTRELGVAAIVSDETVTAAGDSAGLKKIGPHPVKGRAEPVTIWAAG